MFIKLTLAKTNSPIYISPDKIVCLFKHLDESTGGIGTKVMVTNHDESLDIKETPEQVMALVNKAMSAKAK